jgi:hypothetical protein
MPSNRAIVTSLVLSLLYDLLRGGLMSGPVIYAVGRVFQKSRRETLLLWSGSSVALAFALVFFGPTSVGNQSNQPNLSVNID